MIIDPTGTELIPGNGGEDCPGNGLFVDENGRTPECCCDECDYYLCCFSDDFYPHTCRECPETACPRRGEADSPDFIAETGRKDR